MNKVKHMSDCAQHNEPALRNEPCDCGATERKISDEMTPEYEALTRIHANINGLGKDTEEQLEADFELLRSVLQVSNCVGLGATNAEKRVEFEKAARPLMKYLNDNHHPMTKVIVDGTRAEAVEGLISFNTEDYIKD